MLRNGRQHEIPCPMLSPGGDYFTSNATINTDAAITLRHRFKTMRQPTSFDKDKSMVRLRVKKFT